MSNQNVSLENFQAIENKDLFMVCFKLNQSALSALPLEYKFRNCRKDELDIWKKFISMIQMMLIDILIL